MDCVTVKDYIIKSVPFVCALMVLNLLKLFINSKHPSVNPLQTSEALEAAIYFDHENAFRNPPVVPK